MSLHGYMVLDICWLHRDQPDKLFIALETTQVEDIKRELEKQFDDTILICEINGRLA